MTTAQEHLRQMAARLVARTGDLSDVSEGSVIAHVLAAVAFELGSIEIRLRRLREAFFLTGAQGRLLDERAREFPHGGLERLPPSVAVGAVTLERADTSGAQSAPAGVLLARADRPEQTYRTTVAAAFAIGVSSVTVLAAAIAPGPGGNCRSNLIRKILDGPSWLTGASNPSPFDGGTAGESDEALRTRLLMHLSSLARCQPVALELAALSHRGSDGRRATWASIFEDPIHPGYSELVIDDGTDLSGLVRAGTPTSGTAPASGALILWHESPATRPIDRIEIQRGASTFFITPEDGFVSAPERGMVYLRPGLLLSGDTWTISRHADESPYQVFTGLVADLQRLVDGDPSDPNTPGLRAAGTRVVVRGARPQMLAFDAHIVPIPGVSLTQLAGDLKDAAVLFCRRLRPGQTLYVAQLMRALTNDARVQGVRLFAPGTTQCLDDQPPLGFDRAIRTEPARIRVIPRPEE